MNNFREVQKAYNEGRGSGIECGQCGSEDDVGECPECGEMTCMKCLSKSKGKCPACGEKLTEDKIDEARGGKPEVWIYDTLKAEGYPLNTTHSLGAIRNVLKKNKYNVENSINDIRQNNISLTESITDLKEGKAGKRINKKSMKISNLADLKHFIVRSYSITGKDKKDMDEVDAQERIMTAKNWPAVKSILDDFHWDQKDMDDLYDALISFAMEDVDDSDNFFKLKLSEKTDDLITQVLNVVTKANKPLIQLGPTLESEYGKKNVNFAFSPYAHYRIKVKSQEIVIINKKYVNKPDAFVGDIAIGYM